MRPRLPWPGRQERLKKVEEERDALLASQNAEIERQVQARQDAWSERETLLRKELDEQRAAHATERAALKQEHQQKLLQATEESKAQLVQVRRQLAEAEIAGWTNPESWPSS